MSAISERRSGAEKILTTFGFVVLTTIAYNLLTVGDEYILGHVDQSTGSSDQDQNVIQRFTFGMHNFDPNDPDDFRRLVRLALAAGMSAVTLAKMFGMNAGTADRWGTGESVPSRSARQSIFKVIAEWMGK